MNAADPGKSPVWKIVARKTCAPTKKPLPKVKPATKNKPVMKNNAVTKKTVPKKTQATKKSAAAKEPATKNPAQKAKKTPATKKSVAAKEPATKNPTPKAKRATKQLVAKIKKKQSHRPRNCSKRPVLQPRRLLMLIPSIPLPIQSRLSLAPPKPGAAICHRMSLCRCYLGRNCRWFVVSKLGPVYCWLINASPRRHETDPSPLSWIRMDV
jgi:hypothetical protein